MNTQHTDVVAEYLADVERRLAGLPLLQRRELLADLRTHIDTARAEHGAQSEGELIEILERLGSPEVVAAAAYSEAGPMRPSAPPPAVAPRSWKPLVVGLVALGVVLFLLGCAGLLFFAQTSEVAPQPAPPPATATR